MSTSINVNDPINALPTFVVAFDLRPVVACSDESYAEIKQQWINKVYGLQQQLQKEVEKLTADNIEVIDARHDELILKCRAARAAFDEISSQAAFMQTSLRQLSSVATDATFAVSLKRGSPLTPAYATKADIAVWESELDALVEAEKTATKNLYNHQNMMTFWNADVRKAKAAHDALVVEEAELRHRLERLRSQLESA